MKSVDGKLVFDRYATEEEIFGGDILVAPDGNVYEWVNIPVPESDPMYKFCGYTQEWKRSDTHFVEWGLKKNTTSVYVSDIVRLSLYANKNDVEIYEVKQDHYGRSYVDKETFEGEMHPLPYFMDIFEGSYSVIGNVWESPELVGEA